MNDSIERKRACLTAATEACCGDRALNYGAPEDNFRRIADLWNAWIKVRDPTKRTSGSTEPFDPFDVAIMMDLVKTARLANSPGHQDSWIDKAGYAACGADITAASAPATAGMRKWSETGLPHSAPAPDNSPPPARSRGLFRPSGSCYNCGGELIARTNSTNDGMYCKRCGWKQ